MKIILVTSWVNYVPDNYDPALLRILEDHSKHISGVVLIKTPYIELIKWIVWLRTRGCKNTAKTLLKNITEVSKKISLFQDHNIPVLQAKDVNDQAVVNWLRQLSPDIIINTRARCYYQKNVLSVPKLGCVNVHHGILPKYRGLFCDLYALAENRPPGFSLHRMTEKIDDGEIFLVQEVEYSQDKNYQSYLQKATEKEGVFLSEFIQYITEHEQLPESLNRQGSDFTTSSLPSNREIKEMKRSGLIL